MIEQSEIFQELSKIMDPELERDIVSLEFISAIDIQQEKVIIHFRPDTITCPILDRLVSEIKQVVLQVRDVKQVDILIENIRRVTPLERGELPFGGIGHLNKINKVIAVMSGKCRARKCMVSSLIAIYLRKAGYQVGLLDTDMTDRNICKMFFPQRPSPQFSPRAMLPAVTASGIKMMALSVHLPDNSAELNYYSPLVMQKTRELYTNVFWGDLDYLIVDMPSGIYEGPQEMLRSLNVNGVILVTSPHDLDGLVVKNTAALVKKTEIRILGLVENQSDLDKSDNEFADVVFTPGHLNATAKSLEIPVLGRIPVESGIATLCDQGRIEECKVPAFEDIAHWIIKNA